MPIHVSILTSNRQHNNSLTTIYLKMNKLNSGVSSLSRITDKLAKKQVLQKLKVVTTQRKGFLSFNYFMQSHRERRLDISPPPSRIQTNPTTERQHNYFVYKRIQRSERCVSHMGHNHTLSPISLGGNLSSLISERTKVRIDTADLQEFLSDQGDTIKNPELIESRNKLKASLFVLQIRRFHDKMLKVVLYDLKKMVALQCLQEKHSEQLNVFLFNYLQLKYRQVLKHAFSDLSNPIEIKSPNHTQTQINRQSIPRLNLAILNIQDNKCMNISQGLNKLSSFYAPIMRKYFQSITNYSHSQSKALSVDLMAKCLIKKFAKSFEELKGIPISTLRKTISERFVFPQQNQQTLRQNSLENSEQDKQFTFQQENFQKSKQFNNLQDIHDSQPSEIVYMNSQQHLYSLGQTPSQLSPQGKSNIHGEIPKTNTPRSSTLTPTNKQVQDKIVNLTQVDLDQSQEAPISIKQPIIIVSADPSQNSKDQQQTIEPPPQPKRGVLKGLIGRSKTQIKQVKHNQQLQFSLSQSPQKRQSPKVTQGEEVMIEREISYFFSTPLIKQKKAGAQKNCGSRNRRMSALIGTNNDEERQRTRTVSKKPNLPIDTKTQDLLKNSVKLMFQAKKPISKFQSAITEMKATNAKFIREIIPEEDKRQMARSSIVLQSPVKQNKEIVLLRTDSIPAKPKPILLKRRNTYIQLQSQLKPFIFQYSYIFVLLLLIFLIRFVIFVFY